jgi:hypothetical protein
MNDLLHSSVALYQRLLYLYPRELREDFGDEMTLAFADDLEQAWGDARWAGVLQIWWYALSELVTVALPAQQSNRYIMVPAVSFVACVGADTALMLIAAFLNPHAGTAEMLESQWFLVPAVSVINALVALIVTCFCARCPMTVLRLE